MRRAGLAGEMDLERAGDRIREVARDFWRAALTVSIGMIAIPLAVGAVFHVPPFDMLGLVSAVLLFQALAVLVGVALSLSPIATLIAVTSVAASTVLFIMEIADLFSERSGRVQDWIARMDEITNKFDVFFRFGDLVLVAVIWIPGIGLYGCAIIAWMFGWRNPRALLLMLTGWVIACVVVLFTARDLVAVIT